MRHNLFLPAGHSQHDLVLAGQVSDVFRSGELYVTWSQGGTSGAPTVAAAIREQPGGRAGALAEVVQGISLLWSALAQAARPAR